MKISSKTTSDNTPLISIKQAAELLSVSTATVRNWIKLGRLTPAQVSGRKIQFKKSDIDRIIADILSGKSDKLTKRRNKKALKGVTLYTDYIQDNGANILIGAELVKKDPSVFSEECIRVVLADLALKLFLQTQNLPQVDLHRYLNEHSDDTFAQLLRDLLKNADDSKYKFLIDEIGLPEFVPYQDFLGFIYISISKMASRKSTGTYFTPISVVETLMDELCSATHLEGKTIADPCCGTGNFLLAAVKRGVAFSDLYGRDIDEIAICIAKLNLFLNGITDVQLLNEHITNADSLRADFPTHFDIILGNPPWGFSYSENEIKALTGQYRTASLHGTESYDLFLERTITLLNSNGIAAYVLPEALLNVKSHSQARNIIKENCSISFVNYIGNVFDGVVCPCIILGIKKDNIRQAKGCIVTTKKNRFTIQTNRSLNENYWNFTLSDEDSDCIHKIATVKNAFTLKGNADFALGIVTGNNKEFIFPNAGKNRERVLRGGNLHKYYFSPSESYIRFEPEHFQQVAPEKYYRAPEKLIYRFICSTPVFSYDNHQTLSLNSANIVIPHVNGISAKYILAILNSRTISYWCRKKFNSVKLLRSHIEKIPLPFPDERTQKDVIDQANILISGTSQEQKTRMKTYDSLENMIMDLYGLNSAERALICNETRDSDTFL